MCCAVLLPVEQADQPIDSSRSGRLLASADQPRGVRRLAGKLVRGLCCGAGATGPFPGDTKHNTTQQHHHPGRRTRPVREHPRLVPHGHGGAMAAGDDDASRASQPTIGRGRAPGRARRCQRLSLGRASRPREKGPRRDERPQRQRPGGG